MIDRRDRPRSRWPFLAFFAIVVLVPAGYLGLEQRDSSAPSITITAEPPAIGRKSLVKVEASEPRWGVRELRVVLVQGATEVPLGEQTRVGRPWWQLWGGTIEGNASLELEVGSERIPELVEGAAKIRAEATNDSWARFGSGRTTIVEKDLPVLLRPPRIEVLSTQHHIRQGGAECVVYRVSETAVESGVLVGGNLFRGYPLGMRGGEGTREGEAAGAGAGTAVPEGAGNQRGPGQGLVTGGGGGTTRFALFAFAHDLPLTTAPVLVARDAAGNETTARFLFKLFPKPARRQVLELSDDILTQAVPEILAQARIASQNDPLKDFLEVNGRLRRVNAAMLVELAGSSKPERIWKGPFLQLGGSKVESSFADHRLYRYRGKIVDEQDHLGFDLAVTTAHPVGAANDGVVVLAKYFGIYGNTVVLDHGVGLMTLYSHLSTIDVSPGQAVRRGDLLGRTGATGLAGGDHLHFSVMVQGIFVDPVEWWDGHWIQDRVESKLGAAR